VTSTGVRNASGHQGLDFIEMPRTEVVGVDSHIHGEGVRHLWQTCVGKAEEVRRSAIGTVPDAQGIVTEHDQLAVDRNAATLSSQENSSFNLRACLS